MTYLIAIALYPVFCQNIMLKSCHLSSLYAANAHCLQALLLVKQCSSHSVAQAAVCDSQQFGTQQIELLTQASDSGLLSAGSGHLFMCQEIWKR